jgi:hypothetical protein
VKGLVWFGVMVLGMAACGGATTAATTSTVAAPPATTSTVTAPPAVQVAGADLSGLGFEVHQEPG